MRERIIKELMSRRFEYQCEDDLQQAIASVLSDCSIPFVREHRMNAKDRPDFTVEKIAVEVKIEGSVTAVTRQLHRYAQLDEVDEVVLVTSRSKHRSVPREMNGKPVSVVYLNPL